MSRPITISEAKEQFKVWRSNKPSGERIPEALWKVIDQILSNPNYNRSSVTKGLGVSTSQLKKRFPEHYQQKQPANKFETTKFVKASLAQIITTTQSTPVITIERHNGVKLSIAAPTAEQFTVIVKSFMEQ